MGELVLLFTSLSWASEMSINGGLGVPAGYQLMMELSYGMQFGDNIRVQPNIHYIVNPDQFNERGRVEDLDNAWVAGLRFDVDLAGLVFIFD